MTASSTHPTGHEMQSAKTRAQLIEAAIGMISAVGYDCASTRALARAANTPLSSIPYHFGGKKELYLAAAETIADQAHNRFEDALRVLETDTPPDKAARLEQALINLLDVMLDDAEPQSWTPFVARCTQNNDAAFAVIHEKAIGPMLDRLTLAACEVADPVPGDETLRLRLCAIVTAILGFRVLRGVMQRTMGWTEIRPGGVAQIEKMIRDLCRSGFLTADFVQKPSGTQF